MIFKEQQCIRSTSEASLQINVIRWLRSLDGVEVFRIQASSKRGAPDLILCKGGRFIGVELKANEVRGKMSANQHEVKRLIEAAGGTYICVKTLNELKEKLLNE